MPQMWNCWSQNYIGVGFLDLNFRQFTHVIGFCNFLIIIERTTQTFCDRNPLGFYSWLSPSMPQMWKSWSQNCISGGFLDFNFRQFTRIIGFSKFLIIIEMTTQTFLWPKSFGILFLVVPNHASDVKSFGILFLVVPKHASDVKSLVTKLYKCRFPGFEF